MSPQPPQPDAPILLGLVAGIVVLLALAMARRVDLDRKEEVRLAIERRDRLERELRKKDEQLDGALAHISSLTNGRDPEPRPEPAGE